MSASNESNGDAKEDSTIFPDALAHNLGLAAIILMAVAAIFIAWTGYQSAKWSGVQTINLSEAGAARTESTVFSTLAGQQAQTDIGNFTNWLNALHADITAGDVADPGSAAPYVPTSDTLSGFLFERLREDFRPALDAWLSADPLNDPAAPATPFDIPEYDLEALRMADDLTVAADESARLARVAREHSDDYVILTVLAAMAIFFAGASTQLINPRPRVLALGVGVLIFAFAFYLVLSLPIEFSEI